MGDSLKVVRVLSCCCCCCTRVTPRAPRGRGRLGLSRRGTLRNWWPGLCPVAAGAVQGVEPAVPRVRRVAPRLGVWCIASRTLREM